MRKKMRFGELLKKIRTDNRMSLRDLGKSLDVSFTFVDKIEKGVSPVSKNFLEKVLNYFTLNKKELVEAYIQEYVPAVVLEELKKKDEVVVQAIKNLDSQVVFEFFFKNLDTQERKELLTELIEKFEYKSYKEGTLEKNREKIEIIKEKIKNLK